MVGWLTRLFSSQPANTKALEPELVEEEIEPAEPEPQVEESVASEPPPLSFRRISWMQNDSLNASLMSWLLEGYDQSNLFASPLEKKILEALDKLIRSNQVASDMVRRMPGVLPQLLQNLRTEDFSGAEMARTISNDVVLVAEVIRIANSALYRVSDKIDSIEHAILVLGHTGLKQLITSVAFKPIIDLKSGHYTRMIAPKIWEHSEKCAVANRILAEGEPVVAFEAFLAGLTQYVGLIVSLRVIDQLADSDQSIGSASFCSSLLEYGRKMSCSIGHEWNFPQSVVQAIGEQGNIKQHAPMSPLGLLLETGDYISKLKILADNRRIDPGDAELLRGVSEKAVSSLQELQSLGVAPDA
jgi:HD-like signal output (HDOD) protein